jgi:CRISPR-associated protein Cas2
MWVMVFFDLPTETKTDKKNASDFRKNLQKDGFSLFQYSIYVRYCASKENAEVHTERVKKILPRKGQVSIMTITDKQFASIINFECKAIKQPLMGGQQLEMF